MIRRGKIRRPIFFWDCVARITEKSWTLEMRIPFSSLRYRNNNPQTWGILLYRNRPRDFRYQIFSARLPRGGNCFVCRSNPLLGLSGLPEGGHIVLAPYFSASDAAVPIGSLGTPLNREPVDPEFGLDLKWAPNADNVVDATVNPDFSQVESDTAQISANERFALFYPEKRPFFLEGVDLFATPIQAVYTRTITAPDWGGRTTGKAGGIRYTALVAEDDGGGTVIVPGPVNSEFAEQVFKSTVLIGRAKRDIGLSYVSLLATDREGHDGGGYNRVAGPDFQWRPSGGDNVKGQWLWSSTKTPNRPDLTPSWTGETIASHGASIEWSHDSEHFDWFSSYKDFGDDFRADTGFVPQVGYRQLFGYTGWTVRPDNFLSRLRTFATLDQRDDRDGTLISRELEVGSGMDTKLNGFMQFRFLDDRVRLGAPGDEGRAQRFAYFVRISPSRIFAQLSADGRAGEEFDFANGRLGNGAIVNLSARMDPTKNLEVEIVQNQQLLNIEGQRLFTARVSRVRGVYTFTPRSFVRAIVQYVSTERDPALYLEPVDSESAFLASSILFAYKLNWQSVLFFGYGDDREQSDLSRLEKSGRQAFVKVSYAFQR